MRKYIYILAAATLVAMSGCSSFDEEVTPTIETSDDNTLTSPVIKLEDGQTGVYLNLVPKSSETVTATTTRSAASGTELAISDGWAFVFKAAKPTVFDDTNVDGYGHSSTLLEITKLTINANNVAFFTFDQYPWVKTAGEADYTLYGAIPEYNYFVDDNGNPILTDVAGNCNFYYNEEGEYYAPHVYDANGDEVEYTGSADYIIKYNVMNTDEGGAGYLVPEGLRLIYSYTGNNESYGYYLADMFDEDGTDGIVITADGVSLDNELGSSVLSSTLRLNYGTEYEYDAGYDEDEDYYTTTPIKGLNNMCFIRFMVNLTNGTTAEINAFVTQRMVNNGEITLGVDDEITTFEDYKHLSVGLDAYYGVEIDETDIAVTELLEGGTPNPQGTIQDGSLAEQYPMASPGIEMSLGLNEYTLYGLDENDNIELVQVGSKVDVETLDDDFSLIGVTLLNGAKRALMRSSVLDNTGVATLKTIELPTNLHYEYRSDIDVPVDGRVGSIQYNEVMSMSSDASGYTYKDTKDYPIYFFPNEGDYPFQTDAGTQFDYSLSHYLEEDFTNISDPTNGYNPTYLIIRGFIAEYHDRNGNGVYDAISTDGAIDDVGYYKVPIKYLLDENTYTYNIIRCNYYTVQLTSVNNAGYKSFEEAKNGPASDISYDIVIGGTSDDRNEYATSGGTFYLETDANDIYIKGYDEADYTDESDPFEATFNVTIVNNAYDALTDSEVFTKATEGDENYPTGTSYGTPMLYLTVTDGITITGYDVDGVSYNFAEPTSTTTTTSVYEIEAESGDVNNIRFQTSKSGQIYVQAGDIFKQINVYYESLAYFTAGDYTYDVSTSQYVKNAAGFNVDGSYPFEEYSTTAPINSILYDEDYYTPISNFSDASNASAEQVAYSQFIDITDGSIIDNRYTENGYDGTDAEYHGHYLNRECRAIAYRSEGMGIAKIYLKQATDFGLLLGDGTDSDAYVASENTIVYTSRGYIYSLDFSDDGSTNYSTRDNTITYSDGGDECIVAEGSNQPILFCAAGDPDQVDLVTVSTVNSYGRNTITKSSDGTTGYNFCSGGFVDDIEDGGAVEAGTYIYTAETTTDDRQYIESTAMSNSNITSLYTTTQASQLFNLWAYPILRNQGTDFDYLTAGSSWEYEAGTSYLDDVITVTLTNIAGEEKNYTFNLKQYALPFWDPTLSILESDTDISGTVSSYIGCNFPCDLGYASSTTSGGQGGGTTTYTNYTNIDGSSSLPDDYISDYFTTGHGSTTYTKQSTSAAMTAPTYQFSRAVGAVVVYNCNYNNGSDYAWVDVTGDDDDLANRANVQAYDNLEPEYVVFTVFSPTSAAATSSTTTTGFKYFRLRMSNDADEETYMHIRIERDDSFVEGLTTGDYYYFNFLPLNNSGQREVAGNYTDILHYLTDEAYTSTIYNK